MAEFLNLLSPTDAWETWKSRLTLQPVSEWLDTQNAFGRVISVEITAPHPLPTFSRSTVDGYAVRARDTFGASESLPAYMNLAGEVLMGLPAEISVAGQECALIHTGGMIPAGADAVVMLENTQTVSDKIIEVTRPVSLGENVIHQGEDVSTGQVIFLKGSRIRSVDIGGLMGLGLTRVQVAKKPLVGILSCGDEVVPPDQGVLPGQVRDVNGFSLTALAEESGARVKYYGIVPDKLDELKKVAHTGLRECDIMVITAGSSASARDLTAEVIRSLASPGILVHGLNIRPGKPTILASCAGKPVLGLPGNPVSAYIIAWLFLVPIIHATLGIVGKKYSSRFKVELAANVPSQAGREDWIPVQLSDQHTNLAFPQAMPIFARSNNIFSLVRCDGLIRIPADATGLHVGNLVELILFQ